MNIVNGGIYWVQLDKRNADSCVQAGRRPCIAIGNKKALRFSSVITVIPCSTKLKTKKNLPAHITIQSTPKTSCLLPEQITTVDSHKIGNKIGELTSFEKSLLKSALLLQFGI